MMATRKYWLETMLKIVTPVLEALAEDRLRETMSIEGKKAVEQIQNSTYLEAFGRVLAGIAPWLGQTKLTGEEEILRLRSLELVYRCLDNGFYEF